MKYPYKTHQFRDETITQFQLAKLAKINASTISGRVSRGWGIEEASLAQRGDFLTKAYAKQWIKLPEQQKKVEELYQKIVKHNQKVSPKKPNLKMETKGSKSETITLLRSDVQFIADYFNDLLGKK